MPLRVLLGLKAEKKAADLDRGGEAKGWSVGRREVEASGVSR